MGLHGGRLAWPMWVLLLVLGCKGSVLPFPEPEVDGGAVADAGVEPDAGPVSPGCGAGCAEGFRCIRSTCVPEDCQGRQCTGDAVCVGGRCVAEACAGLTCPSGTACAGGVCLPTTCSDKACTAVEVCVDGQCVEDACVGVSCSAGSVCAGGMCAPLGCGGAACPTGQACVDGACRDTACAGVTCAAEQACVRGACLACPPGSEDGGSAGCVPKLPPGSSCTAHEECGSGACAEGLCCATACDGPCQRCNAQGVCEPVPEGTDHPQCGTYTCAAGGGCRTSCTDSMADCQGGASCVDGACVDVRSPGESCLSGKDCASGFCADGLCCDRACDAPCEQCNRPGSDGVCGPVPAGTAEAVCGIYTCSGDQAGCPTSCKDGLGCAPGLLCVAGACVQGYAQGQPCQLGEQCASGTCADGVCCDRACTGPCETCNGVTPGTCAPVPAGSGGRGGCGASVCSGTSGNCPESCSGEVGCLAGHKCVGGACIALKDTGARCTASTECTTGQCVDGVCCASACAGACESCAVPGTEGSCRPELAGTVEPACGAYACSGANAGCPTSCSTRLECAAGLTCVGGACVAGGADGTPCSADAACGSGFCVGGLCCDGRCDGVCETCALAGAEGHCRPRPARTEVGTCGTFACDGTVTTACPTGCASNAACPPDRRCEGGACVPALTVGNGCGVDGDCATGHCVGGRCCDGACSGPCEACNLPGREGRCSALAAGTEVAGCGAFACDGQDGGCPGACTVAGGCAVDAGFVCSFGLCAPPAANGTACEVDGACQSGRCVDGYCCNGPCNGVCDACNVAGLAGTCAPVPAGQAGSGACGAYACDGFSASSCPTGCTSDAVCAPGNRCVGGACVARFPNGRACTAAVDCASGQCVDGVCCDGACARACEACNLAGSEGHCSPVAAGQVEAACGDYACSGLGAGCPTTCVRSEECVGGLLCLGGVCQVHLQLGEACQSDASCRAKGDVSPGAARCVDGVCCSSACSGSCEACNVPGKLGQCVLLPSGGAGDGTCGAYTCNGFNAGCPASCGSSADCVQGYRCGATSHCEVLRSLGSACAQGAECASGKCVDGVCCGSACDGPCDACNLSGLEGTCSPRPAGTNAGTCGSYLCDGVSTACPTQCTRSSQCGSSTWCDATGHCVATLSTGNPTACTSNAQCVSGFCVDGVCCDSACGNACDRCDLAGKVGTCSAVADNEVGTPSCGKYLCNGQVTCPTQCVQTEDCTAGYACVQGACVSPRTLGSPCGEDAQCASGQCVDGVCCNGACGGGCDACNLPGLAGTCSPRPLGFAGAPDCGSYACDGASGACPGLCLTDAQCDTGNYCDGSGQCVPRIPTYTNIGCTADSQCQDGHCVDGVCCESACGAACDACNLVGYEGQCRPAPAKSSGNGTCGAYACDGTNTGCPGACFSDDFCPTGQRCDAVTGACVNYLPLGRDCLDASLCASQLCVDGVCCGSACNGNCEACDVAGARGNCAPVPAGTADGACKDYLCSGVAGAGCPTACVNSAGCVPGKFCNEGLCQALAGNSVPCQSPDNCASGQCVDGYCCDSACVDAEGKKLACAACNVTGLEGFCSALPARSAGDGTCGTFACDGASTSCPTRCEGDTSCPLDRRCGASNTCDLLKDDGAECASGPECASGFCATKTPGGAGTCCNSQCAGECEACDVPGKEGACTPLAAGTAVAECQQYACNGTQGECPIACASSADCAPGNMCQSGICEARLLGVACAKDEDCQSGFCTDGVCCDSRCGGTCQSCSTSGTGNCLTYPARSAGDGVCGTYACDGVNADCPTSCATNPVTDDECPVGRTCVAGNCEAPLVLGPGAPCGAGTECASGFCEDGVCCATACDGECNGCNLPGTEGTCSVRGAGFAGSPDCGEYLCAGDSATCPTSCSGDAQCDTGYYCDKDGQAASQQCLPKQGNGQPCASGSACASGFCADGVCCNQACAEGCDACNLEGKAGQCTAVVASTRGAPACTGGYLCSGQSPVCPTRCNGQGDCDTGLTCVAGACVTLKPKGSPCIVTSECLGGLFCVDGVCCDGACAGGCDACNLAGAAGSCTPQPAGFPGAPDCGAYLCGGGAGSCPAACAADTQCDVGYYCEASKCVPKKQPGASCSGANACASGHCVDGVCCNTACEGSCEACNLANKVGTCSAVARGTAGDPTCGAYVCDGAGAACPAVCLAGVDCAAGHICLGGKCVLPKVNGLACASGPECVSGLCVDGVCCNGACGGACDACNLPGKLGTCSLQPPGAPGAPDCGAYVCGGSGAACLTSCTADAQCDVGNYCNGAGQCVSKKALGDGCTASNQCLGGNCVDGVCCNNACAGSCDACNLVNKVGTCSPVARGTAGVPACGSYLCDGALAACPNTCAATSDCTAGNYCNTATGQCVPKLVQGATCTLSSQCVSDQCVDGVCCNSACGGACDACNLAGKVGACSAQASGFAGDPDCGAYVCGGSGAACLTTCTGDAQCDSGYFCNGVGACMPKLGQGTACTGSNQCASGACADGVCCNTPCGGSCDACNLATSVGTCTAVPAGTAGAPTCGRYLCGGTAVSCPSTCASDTQCSTGSYCNGASQCVAAELPGVACTRAAQCASGSCVDGVCCNTACAGGCDACNLAGKVGTCSNQAVGFTGAPDCGAYLCSGASGSCPSACVADAACDVGMYCNSATSQCVPKQPSGAACTQASHCISGNCVDGVCCSSRCGGACDACNLSGSEGTCLPVAKGLSGAPACSAYVCDGTGALCPSTCTTNPDCAAGYYCNGSSQCAPLPPLGSACTLGTQCASGICVDGVCCNSACGGACDACNLPGKLGTCSAQPAGFTGLPDCGRYVCNGSAGTCPTSCASDAQCEAGSYCNAFGQCVAPEANGFSCTRASQCASGNCVDGACCNSACGGSCDACNVAGKVGTCSVVPAGTAGSPSCGTYLCNGGFTTCPSSCGASSQCAAGASCLGGACVFPKSNGAVCSSNAECASGSCVDGVCCNTACAGGCDACNLAGAVGTCALRPAGYTGAPDCGAYVCSGGSGSCPGSCASDAACDTGYYCSGGTCRQKLGGGSGCTSGTQCASGNCVDGVCCNTACAGSCDRCNLAGALGTCTVVSSGTAGAPGCGNYLCNGTAANCPTTCTGSSQCTNSTSCIGGLCQSGKANGTACSSASECVSGYCVDGVCCNSACSGGCDACNVVAGSCTLKSAGFAGSPDCGVYVCNGSSGSCPTSCGSDANCDTGYICSGGVCTVKKANGSACSGNSVCASGFCVGGICCSTSCSGSCVQCSTGTCANRSNGTRWGNAAQVCCGGSAVDITSSETHCGGCSSGCAGGRSCQSVSVTSGCSSAPAGTSGRCTCGSNSQCPRNQTCRMGQSRYNNLCAPVSSSNCAASQQAKVISSCPNYCYY